MQELLLKPKKISKILSLPFDIGASGWYVLSVTARVRDEKQCGADATDDEDLRVEIDGEKFPKLNNPQRYFDSPAAFSGGKSRNTLKTVHFIGRFKAGEHAISLIPDQGALVEQVSVQVIVDPSHVVFDLNQQAEDENNKPWLTFVLMDVGLKSFTVKAQTRWRFPDGDDIKIIVDDNIKKNKSSILHRNWIFASSVIKKFFGSETSEKTFEENLEVQKLHYVEIWSDKTPTAEFVSFKLEVSAETEPIQTAIKTYNPGPSGQNYNQYNNDIEESVQEWNNKFLLQKYPPPEPLDPNLVKAMIYIETGMGQNEGANEPYPDIMQVGDIRNPAIHTLNNDGWVSPITKKVAREYELNAEGAQEVLDYHGESNAAKPEQSIHWGVRWLYHKAQGITDSGKRYWRPWNEAVRNYNSEGNTKYEKEVYDVYKNGIDNRNKKNPVKLWIIIFFLLACGVAGSALFGIQRYNNQGKMWLTFEDSKEYRVDYVLTLHRIKGLGVEHIPVSTEYTNGGNMFAIVKSATPQERIEDLFGGEPYAVVVTGEDIIGDLVKYVLKETGNGLALVPIVGEYGEGDDNDAFDANDISFIDIDNDGVMEVKESEYLAYENAPDEIWHLWYKYDNSAGRYEFFRKDKEIADEWDVE